MGLVCVFNLGLISQWCLVRFHFDLKNSLSSDDSCSSSNFRTNVRLNLTRSLLRLLKTLLKTLPRSCKIILEDLVGSCSVMKYPAQELKRHCPQVSATCRHKILLQDLTRSLHKIFPRSCRSLVRRYLILQILQDLM